MKDRYGLARETPQKTALRVEFRTLGGARQTTGHPPQLQVSDHCSSSQHDFFLDFFSEIADEKIIFSWNRTRILVAVLDSVDPPAVLSGLNTGKKIKFLKSDN